MSLNLFYDEIQTCIRTALPALTEVTESEQAEGVAFLNFAMPYATYMGGEFTTIDDYGICVNNISGEVTIYLVYDVVGPGSGLRTALETLAAAILADSLNPALFQYGKIIDVTTMDWGTDGNSNSTLLTKNSTQRVGRVVCHAIVGIG